MTGRHQFRGTRRIEDGKSLISVRTFRMCGDEVLRDLEPHRVEWECIRRTMEKTVLIVLSTQEANIWLKIQCANNIETLVSFSIFHQPNISESDLLSSSVMERETGGHSFFLSFFFFLKASQAKPEAAVKW